ncbi:MAG TPA: hypothetical protein VMV46_16070 [Thermoanaerobaculia bacterium]|nr:hypothetical protein [Thermoanaerobaculia bacterium]
MGEEILAQPLWLQLWIGWMALVNLAALAFLKRVEARWVLAAFVAAAVTMNAMYAQLGWVRLLGLAHVVFWLPLLVYVLARWQDLPQVGAFAVWIRTLFLTNLASLIVDLVDVVRYLLGDRG